MRILKGLVLTSAVIGFATSAYALEYPIGEPQFGGGMEVAAVYLQPIEMEPAGMMLAADKADIHLEADIHATKDNVNGFANGDWVPYLEITYELTKDGKTVSRGPFMGMVASDGPHYGDNVKLDGPGVYQLTYRIAPPASSGHMAMFGRHVDKETGVAPWFEPFEAKYEFTYAGTGKKGGY